MSTHRDRSTGRFPFDKVQDGEWMRTAIRIQCGERDCMTFMHFKQTGSVRKPPEAAVQYFRRHGWLVGNCGRNDRCPEHASRHRHKEGETMPEKQNSVVPITKIGRQPEPEPLAFDPPALDRDSRRLIYAKLEEVYVDENVGYAAGHTDDTLARGLGCPRVWVEQVREEMFGPVKSNEEWVQLVAVAEAAVVEANRINKESQRLLAESQQMLADARALTTHTGPIERKIGEIRKAMGMK